MKHEQQHDLLRTLHANLDHFHYSPDVGDGADVEVIKSLLALGIREAESTSRSNQKIKSEVA